MSSVNQAVTSQNGRKPLVVAIDGPSGSGKSSTARGVAQRLGLDYLDTGAMYRAVAWAYLDADIAKDDAAAIAETCRAADIQVGLDPTTAAFAVNGTDVTDAIREPRISENVSVVATNLDVRADMLRRQRAIIEGSQRGIVAEGRDITTVVAPDADVRVLLQADPAARVARRAAELGDKADAAQVTDRVTRRDRYDSTVVECQKPADGVTLIDSTFLSLEEVIDKICELIPKE